MKRNMTEVMDKNMTSFIDKIRQENVNKIEMVDESVIEAREYLGKIDEKIAKGTSYKGSSRGSRQSSGLGDQGCW